MKLLLALVAALALIACSPREWFDRWVHDAPEAAQKGGSIGAILGGPQGAAIGTLIGLVVSAIARAVEKPAMERKHEAEKAQLTEHYQAKLERIATTARTVRNDDALTRNTPQQEPPP